MVKCALKSACSGNGYHTKCRVQNIFFETGQKKKHVEVWRQGGMVGKENVVDSGGKHATESLYSILTIVLKIDYNLILSLSPLHYQKHATNS